MRYLAAVIGLPLLLGGCLPLPITIATYALSGVSLVTSGKSTTDHVISAATDQDCSLSRPVFGGNICRGLGPGEEGRTHAVTVSHYPADQLDGGVVPASSSRAGELVVNQQDSGPVQIAIGIPFGLPVERHDDNPAVTVSTAIAARPEAVQVETPNSFAEVEAQLTPTPLTSTPLQVTEKVVSAPLAAPILSPTKPEKLEPIQLAALPSVQSTEEKGVALAPVAPIASGLAASLETAVPEVLKPEAEADRLLPMPAPRPKQLAALKTSKVRALSSGRYLILGSVTDRRWAEDLASQYRELSPVVLKAYVGGMKRYRVAVGPLGHHEASQLKNRLGRVAGKRPWIATLKKPDQVAALPR